MAKMIAFCILSIPLVLISWRTLFSPKSHGFYRFFSWESILWLGLSNIPYWFDDPFTVPHLFSWVLLFIALYLVIAGVILLKKKGTPIRDRDENGLYSFEKTSVLIDTGIYKYIRHPLYSSLIFLTWGIFLKQVTLSLFLISLISTLCLHQTAIFDEKECLEYFGDKYKRYMKQTRRFIPFVV